MAEHVVDTLLRIEGGVVARRRNRAHAASLDRALRNGILVAVLPGLYTRPELRHDPNVRIRAGALVDPNAVLTGAAAARVTYWPGCPLGDITVATPWMRASQPGFHFQRRQIPPELITSRNGIRVTTPSLTALDLADWQDSEALDRAFRLRVVTIDTLHEALRLTAYRDGNRQRRRLLIDSRGEPWSAAERRSHRLLREARISDWTPNLPVRCRDGRLCFIDIAFPRQKLAIEIDGKIHLHDSELFESDRWRQNQLILHGWRVLRFTWDMLVHHPEEVLATIRAALEMP